MVDPTRTEPQSITVSVVIISKDEPALAETLGSLPGEILALSSVPKDNVEILVVDASSGRLDEIRTAHPLVRWIDFVQPEGVRISIPHQRNRGVRDARGDIIVFTDCGCVPEPGWLDHLIAPILSGDERVTCGQTGATGPIDPYSYKRAERVKDSYLHECPTINIAFRREIFDDIGGFDESFEYGSDVDFSWRVVNRGIRIRYVPDAVVRHDWGTPKRQIKRSYTYGKARARLYEKHVLGNGEQSIKKRHLDKSDVVPLAYPLFLLGLPIALRYRSYLLLLLIPIWRNREDAPLNNLIDHFVYAAGMLTETAQILRREVPRSKP